MRNTFKLLSILTFSISMMIVVSSCSLFSSDSNSSSSSNQNQNDNKEENKEEDNKEDQVIKGTLGEQNLKSYEVIDLVKYNHPSIRYRKEYILDEPNKYFTLELNLNNPNKLKIYSVYINNIKYEKENLICSLDYSKIQIKIKSDENYGVQFYKVNKIIYDDGVSEIYFPLVHTKFVLRVKENHKVLASNFVSTSTSSSLRFSFNIIDEDNISSTLPLKYKLVDKELETEELIKEGSLNIGENSFFIDELKEFNNYELTLYYGKYLTEENGSEIFVTIDKFDLMTDRAIEVLNIEASYEKVNFEINNISNVTINKMYLNNLKKNIKEKETTSIVKEFKNISSDTNYSIAIEFTFKNNKYIREFNFKTKAYVAPVFKFKTYNAKYQTIDYEVEFNDPFNLGHLYEVELVGINGKSLKTLKGSFSNCVSNKDYILIIHYYYDLHDGNGNVNKEVSTNIRTLAFDVSDIALNLTLNGKNAVDYEFSCKNPSILTLNSVSLYYNNELKETRTNHEFKGSFSNLYNNTKYVIKANYEIKLEGEDSSYLNTITSSIITRKLNTPEFDLVINPGRDFVDFKLEIDDPYNVFIFYNIKLYRGEEFIDYLIKTSGKFSDLVSGTKYTLRMEYQFNYNDYTFPSITTKDYDFVTDVFTPPEFKISNVEVGVDYFHANVSLTDPTNSIVPGSIQTIVYDKNINHNLAYKIDDFTAISLNNLPSCTSHSLDIKYEYDLNDENGIHTKTFSYDFRTLDKLIVTQYSVEAINYDDPETRYFKIHIVFKNPSKLTIGSVVINGVTLNLDKVATNEINLIANNIINYDPNKKPTLDSLITTQGVSYDVYLKLY